MMFRRVRDKVLLVCLVTMLTIFVALNNSFGKQIRDPSLQQSKPIKVQGLKVKGSPIAIRNDSATSVPANMTLWLNETTAVRDCTNGHVIGKVEAMNASLVGPYTNIVHKSPMVEPVNKRQSAFQKIFNTRAWGGKREANTTFSGISSSGPGSMIDKTREMVAMLEHIFQQIKLQTGRPKVRFLDLPCGDFQWMGKFLDTRNDIEYTGIDIVPNLIDNHRRKFAHRTDWKFIHTDIIEHPINGTYDIILCRMLLQHLVTKDVLTMLKRFSESGATYLLTSTFSEHKVYQEVAVNSQYRFRLVNLEIPPISLTRPLCLSRDGPSGNHYIGLWKLPLTRIPSCKQGHSIISKFKSYSKTFYVCQ